MRKKRLDYYLDKLAGTKLQIVIVSICLFLGSPKFTETGLLVVFGIYMGTNVMQRFAPPKPTIMSREEQAKAEQ